MAEERDRFQLLEVYKEAKGDSLSKIGYISRMIKTKYPSISFLYGMALYAKIEQLFLNHYPEDISQLITLFSTYLKKVGDTLTQFEILQLQTTIQWLETIKQFMYINNPRPSLNQFKQFYNTMFYKKVFREYNSQYNDQSSQKEFLLEDCLDFMCSIVIMNYLASPEQGENEVDPVSKNYHSQTLFGNSQDGEQQMSKISDLKVESLSFVIQVGLRVYLEKVDEVIVFKKVAPEDRLSILSLSFIYDPCENTYRIAYDMNYSAQYSFYINKLNHSNHMNQEVQRALSDIQSTIDKIEQLIQKKKEKNINLNNKNNSAQEENKKLYQLIMNQNQQYQKCCEQCNQLTSSLAQLQNEKQQFYNYINQQQMDQNQRTQLLLKQQEEKKHFQKQQQEQYLQQLKQAEYYQRAQAQFSEQQNLSSSHANLMQSYSPNNKIINNDNVTIKLTKNLECPICNEKFQHSEMAFLNCCKNLCCKPCLQKHFIAQIVNTQNKMLACLFCKKPITNYNELYKLEIMNEQLSKLLTIQLDYECPNCKLRFKDQEGNSQAEVVTAPCCKMQICKSCYKQAHLDGKACLVKVQNYLEVIKTYIATIVNKSAEIQQSITELQASGQPHEKQDNELKENEAMKRFRFCSVCYTICFKDAGCEHVTCTNCTLEFCFMCTAPRKPTMFHDNSFHRDGCRYYANPCQVSEDKCGLFKATNQQCQRPISWKAYVDDILQKYGDVFFQGELQNNWHIEQLNN